MSETQRPSEETQTEYIPNEAPPATREMSGSSSSSIPPASATSGGLPPESDLESTQESAAAYPPPSPELGPPTEAFVPPELMARRRAAAPPSAPYQPIAGWSVAPPASMDPPGVQPGFGQGYPAEPAAPTSAPGQFVDPTRAPAQAAAPANGFAPGPPGPGGHAGPASVAGPRVAQRPPSQSSGPPGWLLGVVGLAVIVVIAAVWIALRPDESKTPEPTAQPTPTAKAEPVELKATLKTFDPTPGGQGFRNRNGAWSTSTYNTAAFGNLKKGVGMILDLGEAKDVAEVSFTDKTGPLAVELRAADTLPSALSGWDKVGDPTTSSGKTTLDASTGGKHRYWLIWVTQLGPDHQGVLTDITAKG